MMKSVLKTLMMLCVISTTSLFFPSCSQDDDEDKKQEEEQEMLVGTWEDGDNILTFKKNGTFELETDYSVEKGKYTYKGNVLILKSEDDEEITYEVISLTSSTLKLEDEDGERYTYKRLDEGKDDKEDEEDEDVASLLIGTWVDDGGDYTDTYTFKSNGTFINIYEGEGFEDEYTGRYEYDDSTLTLYFDDGDVWTNEIISINSEKMVTDDGEGIYTYYKQ